MHLGPDHRQIGTGPFRFVEFKPNESVKVVRNGRVWLTASVRGLDNPAFCKEGSDHPSAKLFPLKQSRRQLAMLDPTTMKYTIVDTCFETHHLQFGFDK